MKHIFSHQSSLYLLKLLKLTHTDKNTHIVYVIFIGFPGKKNGYPKPRLVSLHVQCLFCSILRSSFVHIHSVSCVACNVCDNVQQCDGTAIIWW